MRDVRTGKLNGLLKRSAFKLLKMPAADNFTKEQKEQALVQMLQRYNQYGITSVCEGAGNRDISALYLDMLRKGELTTRVYVNIRLPMDPDLTAQDMVKMVDGYDFKTGDGNEWVKTGALKIILDGGILTGTAFLREPWGEKAAGIYGFDESGLPGGDQLFI